LELLFFQAEKRYFLAFVSSKHGEPTEAILLVEAFFSLYLQIVHVGFVG
jgi:hypothetical protein